MYPPFTMGTDDGQPLTLPEPMTAVDGTHVYEPLAMFSYQINTTDVSFHWEMKPVNPGSECPQYLVFARYSLFCNLLSL